MTGRCTCFDYGDNCAWCRRQDKLSMQKGNKPVNDRMCPPFDAEEDILNLTIRDVRTAVAPRHYLKGSPVMFATAVTLSIFETVYFVNAGAGVATQPVLGQRTQQMQEINGRKFLAEGDTGKELFAVATSEEVTRAKAMIVEAYLARNMTHIPTLTSEQVPSSVALLAMSPATV